MEKAILKTLIYADIFDYPLKAYEIHKWLVGRKATLRQAESAISRLNQKSKIKYQKGYYFLPRRDGLISKRQRREKQSAKYLTRAKLLTHTLQVVPWIKLVGISGGLAMENASKSDDIDLFIITSKNRLWISRLFILLLLSLTGQRRKVGDKGVKIAGKLCINTLLEENRLDQRNKDIYLAHEVLQMRPLWYRDGIYGKYLEDNAWAFKFLPNWVGSNVSLRGVKGAPRRGTSNLLPQIGRLPRSDVTSDLAMTLENLAKWLQLKIMAKPSGMERIQDGAVYFHPNDIRPQILQLYRQKVKEISNT